MPYFFVLIQLLRKATKITSQEPNQLEPSVSCRPSLFSCEGRAPRPEEPHTDMHTTHSHAPLEKVPSMCLLKRRRGREKVGGGRCGSVTLARSYGTRGAGNRATLSPSP